MNPEIGETFISYVLLTIVRKAFSARVFDDYGDDSEEEDRHLSELERRMAALDEKETFVVVKTLFENHRETFEKTVLFLERGSE